MLLSSSFVAEENTQIVVHQLQFKKKKVRYKSQNIHGKPYLSFMCLNFFITAYNTFANFV